MDSEIISKNFLRILFMLEAMQNTDAENPKTARKINREVDEKLHELFPKDFPEPKDEPDKAITATISRHVHDMNLSGLYKIETHRNKKLGYYNAAEGNFPFTAAEFALIAAALYRTPSLSTAETENIIRKFKNLVGLTGEMFSYSLLERQIKVWSGIRRKTYREILPIISKLLTAIIEGKQVSFNLYERSFKHEDEKVPLQTRKKSRKANETIIENFRVSPYFLAWENDECYLIAYSNYPNRDLPGSKQLTHFKVSLITNLQILDKDCERLREMDFYARYAMEPHPYYTDRATRERLEEISTILQRDTQENSFKNFSLDRYMREHIYMSTNAAPTVDVTIEFDKDFLETLLTQLTMKQNVRISPNDNGKYQTIMTVQDNDGLYQWLMRYSDKVTVISPLKVRQNLRNRLTAALEKLGG